MKRLPGVAAVIGLLALAAACRVERPPRGGAPEHDLVAATLARDIPRVQQLLAAGANPNAMVSYDNVSHSAWDSALNQVRTRQPETIELVKILLKAGASTSAAWGGGVANGITREHDQLRVLVAMLHPNAEVVRAILDAGMNPKYGQTALVMAIEQGEAEIAHLLVEHGVDVNCHPGANTPLLAAIETRDVAMMTYLEAHGAREKP